LGNTAASRVAVQQEVADNPGVLYVVRLQGRPANVFAIGVAATKESVSQLKAESVVRMFVMEEQYDWKAIVLRHAKPWWENDKEFVVGNIHELVFDIDLDFA
jgi:hypothetical protein